MAGIVILIWIVHDPVGSAHTVRGWLAWVVSAVDRAAASKTGAKK